MDENVSLKTTLMLTQTPHTFTTLLQSRRRATVNGMSAFANDHYQGFDMQRSVFMLNLKYYWNLRLLLILPFRF
ncbi:hypothetical protein OK016_01025 [Vibrio chagasii]|nr:hypothetical protein [Vibrio chagasii]